MIPFLKSKFHDLVSDKKFSEILTGSAWALGARVGATGLGMISSIIIARFYGAEIMGIVAVLNSFLLLATILTVLGTNTSILRFIPEHLVKYSATSAFRVYRKTQFLVIGISMLSGGLFFFGSRLIADRVFSKPHLSFYFAVEAKEERQDRGQAGILSGCWSFPHLKLISMSSMILCGATGWKGSG